MSRPWSSSVKRALPRLALVPILAAGTGAVATPSFADPGKDKPPHASGGGKKDNYKGDGRKVR